MLCASLCIRKCRQSEAHGRPRDDWSEKAATQSDYGEVVRAGQAPTLVRLAIGSLPDTEISDFEVRGGHGF